MKIFLTSKSEIKINAIKEAFPSNYVIDFGSVESDRAEQPVNNGYECSIDRINHYKYKNDYDYIISIENAVRYIDNDNIMDICYVVLLDISQNKIYKAESNGINVPLEFYEQASKYPILGPLGGFAVTIGEYINNRYPDIPKDNWMKDSQFGGIDRKIQIKEAIFKIVKMLQ